MPSFQGPVAYANPPVPATRHRGNALFRHFGNQPVGQTVLKIGGVYSTHLHPSQALIDTATEVYLGGHIYYVSSAQKTALEAAGYTVDAADPPATSSGGFSTLPPGSTGEPAALTWGAVDFDVTWEDLQTRTWGAISGD